MRKDYKMTKKTRKLEGQNTMKTANKNSQNFERQDDKKTRKLEHQESGNPEDRDMEQNRREQKSRKPEVQKIRIHKK